MQVIVAAAAAALLTVVVPSPATADASHDVPGLAVAESDFSFAATRQRVLDQLAAAPPISVVTEVDHAAAAASAGLELEPTTVLVFGNPQLGTPLMQDSQSTGIDLPQRILVWQDGGDVHVAYNTPAYLADRHGLTGASADERQRIAGALAGIVDKATGNEPVATAPNGSAGLEQVTSRRAFPATQNALERELRQRDGLTRLLSFDHADNAQSVDLDLAPTTVTLLGNPAVGTPLMQAERTIAIDLPQTILVTDDDHPGRDGTTVTYEDPFVLADRHGIDGQDGRLGNIEAALAGLAEAAAAR